MGKKQPNAKFDPNPKKVVPSRVGFDDNPMRLHPAWRIRAMEMCDPYGWHELSPEKIEEIKERIKNFESMKIGEFFGHKKPSHDVKVEQLSKQARDRLEALHLDDLEELASLRVTGKQRIWAVREHHVFNLLWWDPDHQVCPSLKD